jgi:hypothetical protein
MHLSPTRAQVYQVDDPCYDRGRCPTDWYQGQRSYMWYLKNNTNGVIPTYVMVFIKNEDSSVNHLPPTLAFVSMRSTPFMEIDDKGGEIVQRYESFGKD